MRNSTTGLTVLLAAGVLAAGGCGRAGKSVEITFANTTARDYRFRLEGPGEGTRDLGRLPPRSEVRTKVKLDKRDLPATYAWYADTPTAKHTATFVIDEVTPNRIWVLVPEGKVRGRMRERPPDRER